MPRTERILIVTALLAVGLGMTLAVPGGDALPLLLTIAGAMALLAGAGGLWLQRGAQVPGSQAMSLSVSALLPALAAGGFTLFLQIFESGALQTGLFVLAVLSLGAINWSLAHVVDPRDRYFTFAQTALNVLSHLVAFLLFSVIYGLKVRSLASATAVGLIAALLLFDLLHRERAWHSEEVPDHVFIQRLALLSLAAGVVIGEATWALNYWAALTTLVGGAFLLVLFYVAYGLLSRYVGRSLNRRIVAEYAAVGALAVVAVFASAFIA
jgi:hypothetical protein